MKMLSFHSFKELSFAPSTSKITKCNFLPTFVEIDMGKESVFMTLKTMLQILASEMIFKLLEAP